MLYCPNCRQFVDPVENQEELNKNNQEPGEIEWYLQCGLCGKVSDQHNWKQPGELDDRVRAV